MVHLGMCTSLQFIVNVISMNAKMEALVGNLVCHIYVNVWKVSVVYYVKQVNECYTCMYTYMLLAKVANYYCCIEVVTCLAIHKLMSIMLVVILSYK